MLEIVGELIVGILIGVLELIGDALLEGVFESFVKFVAAVGACWRVIGAECVTGLHSS